MGVAEEIQVLLLIHDRLTARERPFVREMAVRLEQRGSLSVKQLAAMGRILNRHRISTVPAQVVPDQLALLAEPVIRVVEALRPNRFAQPAKGRPKRRHARATREANRNIGAEAAAPFIDDPLPW